MGKVGRTAQRRASADGKRLERLRALLEHWGIDRPRQRKMAQWYWKKGGLGAVLAAGDRRERERVEDIQEQLREMKRQHVRLHRLVDPSACEASRADEVPRCDSIHKLLRRHVQTWRLLFMELSEGNLARAARTKTWIPDPDKPETNRKAVIRTLVELAEELKHERERRKRLGASAADLEAYQFGQKDMVDLLLGLKSRAPGDALEQQRAYQRFKIELSELRASDKIEIEAIRGAQAVLAGKAKPSPDERQSDKARRDPVPKSTTRSREGAGRLKKRHLQQATKR